MIRKRNKIEIGRSEAASSQKPDKSGSGMGSFAIGFIEGFASTGLMFRSLRQSPQKETLATEIARVPAPEQKDIAALFKRKMAAKYVGKIMAKKLCSVSTGTGKGRARRIDALMIHRDFATAVSKIYG